MKKALLTLLVALVAIAGHAQNTEDFAQPTQVVARRINSSGQVTKEFVSEFSYGEDGKLVRYDFPEYVITSRCFYSDDFLIQDRTRCDAHHPYYTLIYNYTYDENGNLETYECNADNFGLDWGQRFEYYDDGRLKMKEYKFGSLFDDYHEWWLYEYENRGTTIIEAHWTSYGTWLCGKKTTQLDDNYDLLSEYTESYNQSGETTSAKQVLYTYTPAGKIEEVTKQTLTDGEWQNKTVTRYAYDDENRLAEQLDGVWDLEAGEWDFNKKITFETSEDETLYTVSFFKKNGDEWVRDVFDNQTILFGPNFKLHQRCLMCLVNDPLNEQGKVNQIEFTMVHTKAPTYLNMEERGLQAHRAYPNPASQVVRLHGTEAAEVQLYNTLGQLVKTVQNTNAISLEGLPKGVYVLRVITKDGKVFSDKVIKE